MILFVGLGEVIRIHDELIEEYGGRKGIHDLGLLKSAIEMPRAYFNGKYLHRDIYDKAAAYLFHISKNHPFLDGNKRTAGMISMLFLDLNDVAFHIATKSYEELILQTVEGKIAKKEIAKFFRDSKITRSKT